MSLHIVDSAFLDAVCDAILPVKDEKTRMLLAEVQRIGMKPMAKVPALQPKYPHYYVDVRHLQYLDVYQVIHLFQVRHPTQQHAIKKMLTAGLRGLKAKMGFDASKDIEEAIFSLERWQEMEEEKKLALDPQLDQGMKG